MEKDDKEFTVICFSSFLSRTFRVASIIYYLPLNVCTCSNLISLIKKTRDIVSFGFGFLHIECSFVFFIRMSELLRALRFLTKQVFWASNNSL